MTTRRFSHLTRAGRRLLLVASVMLLMVAPAAGDSRSWDWQDGDCSGSPGAVLADQTIDVEPGTSVCVLPPSYQMTAGPRYYVGVEIEGEFFPGTSEADLRCRTSVGSPVLVHSTTACTVESGRQPGRIDFTPRSLNTLFVDHEASGADDGSSWTDAYTDLSTALSAAVAGDQIWVAEGVYKPGGASPTRSSAFAMKNGVRIYGGFDGTEAVRTERDPYLHETVLSGDIGAQGVVTDNVYHVVHAQDENNTALLDGFTVTGGRADGAANNDRGGGLYAYYGWPTIVNVDFVDNYAVYGGGIYNIAAPITVVNSGFYGNEAGTATGFGNGGGFHGSGDAEKLLNCVFSGNIAAWQGGAGYFSGGSFGATLRNLTISGNKSVSNTGGGLYLNTTYGLPWTIANVILWGNTWGTTANQLTVVSGTPTTISYSLIQGGWATGTNILTEDPLFADADGEDNVVGTRDDDLRLPLSSPAIDAGDNAAVPADETDLDADGNTAEPLSRDRDDRERFYDVASKADTGSGTPPIVDMGAYEAIDAVDADLAIVKDDGFPEAVPGADLSYWIQATNPGTSDVFGATVSDPFPAELTDCSWTCSPGVGAACSAFGSGDIDDTVDLPVGSDVTYVADCLVDPTASGTLANTATIDLPGGFLDVNPGDNSSTDTDALLLLGSCGAPDDREISDVDVYGDVLIEACNSITVERCRVYGMLELRAGVRVELGNEFAVEEDGQLEIRNELP